MLVWSRIFCAKTRGLCLSRECRSCTVTEDTVTRWGGGGLDPSGIFDCLGITGCCHCFTALPPVYAVALAKKSAKQIHIHNLRGRRSCHSHLYSPAGWLLLSRHTVGAHQNDTESCDIASGKGSSGFSLN